MQRTWPKSFADRLTSPLPKTSDVIKLIAGGRFRGAAAEADRIPVLRNGMPAVAASQTSVTWAGHASYVLRAAGACVLADPLWSPRINGFLRRLTPPGLAWSELPKVDAVVISHNHY